MKIGWTIQMSLVVLGMSGTVEASKAQPTDADKYALKQVTLPTSAGIATRVGTVEVAIDSPNNEKPRVWEGPLKFKSKADGAWCAVDISLVTQVFLDEKRGLAVVLSYSGSTTFVDFVEVDTCKPKWQRLEAAASGVQIEASQINIFQGCEGPVSRSQCSAGRIFELSVGAPPKLLTRPP